MGYTQADVAELIRYAGQRLLDRMTGLGDEEWAWGPVAGDDQLTLRWRLDHLADAVGGRRNWEWLGAVGADVPALEPAKSAQEAIETVRVVLDRYQALITRPDLDLDQPIGPIGGPYAEDPRRALVLHAADELIHHAAEAAILRDLFAAR